MIDHIVAIFERIGAVASGLRRSVSYILSVAVTASAYLAFKAYDVDSAIWWNAVKCGVVLLPVLIWIVVWLILGQLGQAPEIAKELVDDKDQMLQHFSQFDVEQATSVRGVYSTLRTLREQDGLEEVMETIGGVGLLINPLFALIALFAFFCLFGLILAAFLVLLF